MKRTIYLAVVILVLMFFAYSCTSQKASSNATAGTSVQSADSTADIIMPEKKSEIDVQSPMTLSNTGLTFSGQPKYLRMKMVKGRYYEDWSPGGMGTLWKGSFVMDLVDESDNIIAETDISKMFSEPLTFNSSFNIEFDDYNNDGNLDFTIGQYGSSNGYLYKIFTLREDGKVEELPVKDHPDLFISNRTGNYSTKLNKINETAFEVEYYDNSIPATFHDFYQWDGNQFVPLKSEKTDAPNNESMSNAPESTKIDDTFNLSGVKINGEKVSASSGLINEFGFNLETFCRDIYPDMKLQILEYSKKTSGGYKGNKVPIKFKVSIGEESVEFEGVTYASPINGEPIAEYISGKFGEIRAKYKSFIYLDSNKSVSQFLDSFGIGYTFYDDKSIDIYN